MINFLIIIITVGFVYEFIYLYILKTSSTRTVSVEFRFYRSHHYLYQNIYVVKHLKHINGFLMIFN